VRAFKFLTRPVVPGGCVSVVLGNVPDGLSAEETREFLEQHALPFAIHELPIWIFSALVQFEVESLPGQEGLDLTENETGGRDGNLRREWAEVEGAEIAGRKRR
jgi:hypothetical protein